MIKEFVLVDPLNQGTSHVYFNAAVLNKLLNEKSDVVFIADTDHLNNVRKIAHSFKPVYLRVKKTTLRVVKSLVLLLKYPKQKNAQIFFLSVDNTILPIIMILLYPCFFNHSISIILHNNIDTLNQNKFKRLLHRVFVNTYKVKVYVLTEQMKKVYDKRFTSKCILFSHPNYQNIIEYQKVPFPVDSSKVNIIVLGRQAKLISSTLESVDLSSFLNLHFIILTNKELKYLEHINTTIIKERVSFDMYYSLLSQADFCFFADDVSVVNRASGILMDCVSIQCPIIAPKVGHFLEYYDFNIGYLYKSPNDLIDIFKTIDRSIPKRELYKSNFISAIDYSNSTLFKF